MLGKPPKLTPPTCLRVEDVEDESISSLCERKFNETLTHAGLALCAMGAAHEEWDKLKELRPETK